MIKLESTSFDHLTKKCLGGSSLNRKHLRQRDCNIRRGTTKVDDNVLLLPAPRYPSRQWNRGEKDQDQITPIHHPKRNIVSEKLPSTLDEMCNTERRRVDTPRNACWRTRRTLRGQCTSKENFPSQNLLARHLHGRHGNHMPMEKLR